MPGALLSLRGLLAIAALLFPLWGTPVVAAPATNPAIDIDQILADLPDGERWLRHLKEDLLPFWTLPTARGRDGDFPTYRCDDGSLPDPAHLCPELAHPIAGIVWPEREFVRAKARQVYAYGVAFHLTGDPRLLELAREGVEFLRQHALDPAGGVVSYWSYPNGWEREGRGEAGPPQAQRRSQDLAYALSGLGFYYYLTRDEAVLKDVIALRDYIHTTYYDPQWDLIAWVKAESPDGDLPSQRELVAQLDQIYGYGIWLAPILPDSAMRSEWEQELTRLASSMINQFYSPRVNFFWGAVNRPDDKRLGRPHVDFGHSIKTLWLIYQIGKMTRNESFVSFAAERAAHILESAYLPDGSWGRRIDGHGQLDTDKEWWILAELDQTAATLALVDPAYARYLPTTYRYWLDTMVDKRHGGIWHMVSGTTHTPVSGFPKQHSWKNAFHSFEHALVSYITAQQLHGEPVVLHFAFSQRPSDETIRPYLFQGRIADYQGGAVQTVTFTDIR